MSRLQTGVTRFTDLELKCLKKWGMDPNTPKGFGKW